MSLEQLLAYVAIFLAGTQLGEVLAGVVVCRILTQCGKGKEADLVTRELKALVSKSLRAGRIISSRARNPTLPTHTPNHARRGPRNPGA